VTASYPGANAQVVAETVAVPLEQQINGVEDMLYMVSQSNNDGSCTLTVTFRRGAQLDIAQVLVQNRVAMAMPILPADVNKTGIATKRGIVQEDETSPVVLALLDRGDHGRHLLRRWAEAVVGRLTEDGVLVKPELFPGPDKKQTRLQIDRARCARLGVTVAEIEKAVRAAGPAAKGEALTKQKVTSVRGAEVPLGMVAVFEEVMAPVAVYRVNMYSAMRISGSPPEGTTRARAARMALEIAEAERQTANPSDGFVAVNLTAR
jgi:multidrug efflux pump subunit AcrB